MESHAGLKVSMDGKARWMDNVFIERLWWSLKYEDVYLKEYRDLVDLEAGVSKWIESYNLRRLHQSLGYRTPWEVYRPLKIGKVAGADRDPPRKVAHNPLAVSDEINAHSQPQRDVYNFPTQRECSKLNE